MIVIVVVVVAVMVMVVVVVMINEISVNTHCVYMGLYSAMLRVWKTSLITGWRGHCGN